MRVVVFVTFNVHAPNPSNTSPVLFAVPVIVNALIAFGIELSRLTILLFLIVTVPVPGFLPG